MATTAVQPTSGAGTLPPPAPPPGSMGMPLVIPVNIVLTAGAAPGAAGTGASFQINNDSDFDLWQLTASAINTGGSGALFSVSIFDTFKNKPFTLGNAQVNGENWFGSGSQPFTLPAPWRFYRRTQVTLVFGERSNNGNNTVQVCFHGYQVNITQP